MKAKEMIGAVVEGRKARDVLGKELSWPIDGSKLDDKAHSARRRRTEQAQSAGMQSFAQELTSGGMSAVPHVLPSPVEVSRVESTTDTWPDGAPVTKGFKKTGSKTIPAGAPVLLSFGASSGEESVYWEDPTGSGNWFFGIGPGLHAELGAASEQIDQKQGDHAPLEQTDEIPDQDPEGDVIPPDAMPPEEEPDEEAVDPNAVRMGDRVNTPDGMGTVKGVRSGKVLVQIDGRGDAGEYDPAEVTLEAKEKDDECEGCEPDVEAALKEFALWEEATIGDGLDLMDDPDEEGSYDKKKEQTTTVDEYGDTIEVGAKVSGGFQPGFGSQLGVVSDVTPDQVTVTWDDGSGDESFPIRDGKVDYITRVEDDLVGEAADSNLVHSIRTAVETVMAGEDFPRKDELLSEVMAKLDNADDLSAGDWNFVGSSLEIAAVNTSGEQQSLLFDASDEAKKLQRAAGDAAEGKEPDITKKPDQPEDDEHDSQTDIVPPGFVDQKGPHSGLKRSIIEMKGQGLTASQVESSLLMHTATDPVTIEAMVKGIYGADK
jgi:hypothetical protein